MVEILLTNIVASHGISGRLAGGCPGSHLGYMNWISQLCFLHNQNLTWNKWTMIKKDRSHEKVVDKSSTSIEQVIVFQKSRKSHEQFLNKALTNCELFVNKIWTSHA